MGVGIIGASTSKPGWAVRAYVPAIRASSQIQLRAVAASNRTSANAAHSGTSRALREK